ncbi:unnamed protein product [Hymenolepis diminuta]|uniref:Uncharacterized protein n=1 Tax=Hymenolepis diminuta TaxID=6216 RepID=A0A564YLJ1_HYMDI|nr:unnamed protein product [Hymenolepis diminuta]
MKVALMGLILMVNPSISMRFLMKMKPGSLKKHFPPKPLSIFMLLKIKSNL